MANKYWISWDSTALVAATAKTIIELPTPANTMIDLKELMLSFDATSAGSCNVEFGTFSSSGTGTAATPQKWAGNPNVDSAISAAEIKSTVEPTGFSAGTAGALLYPGYFVPLPGMAFLQWPLAEEFQVVESINFEVRLTSTVACNVKGWIAWIE